MDPVGWQCSILKPRYLSIKRNNPTNKFSCFDHTLMKFIGNLFCDFFRGFNVELIMSWNTELHNTKEIIINYPFEQIYSCNLEDSTTSTLSFCYHRGSLSSVSLPSFLVKLGLYLNTFLQKVCNSSSVAELFIRLAFLLITHTFPFI